MKKTLSILLLSLTLSSPLAAQNRFALPTQAERNVADIGSYATVAVPMALDALSCRDSADKQKCFGMMAVRDATTFVVAQLLKRAFHQSRPCAPSCGIDNPNEGMPSMHMAFVVSALGGNKSAALNYSMILGTTAGRYASNKHDKWQILAGVGLGALTSRIR